MSVAANTKNKPPKYFYLILIIIPLIFFLLLEFGLRIFGYGFNNEQWDTATEGKLMLNQEIDLPPEKRSNC